MPDRVKGYIAVVACALAMEGGLCAWAVLSDVELTLYFSQSVVALPAYIGLQLLIILLGVAAWRRLTGKVAIVVAAVTLLGAVSLLLSIYHWDGAFPEIEYVFVFRDVNGNPVQGVELRVLNESDEITYDYPVDDFHSDGIPRSNSGGELVFHHIYQGLEYGGSAWNLFFLFPIDIYGGTPAFYCHFFYEGKEVYALRYEALNDQYYEWDEQASRERGEGLSIVTRTLEGMGIEKLETSFFDSGAITFPVIRHELTVDIEQSASSRT